MEQVDYLSCLFLIELEFEDSTYQRHHLFVYKWKFLIFNSILWCLCTTFYMASIFFSLAVKLSKANLWYQLELIETFIRVLSKRLSVSFYFQISVSLLAANATTIQYAHQTRFRINWVAESYSFLLLGQKDQICSNELNYNCLLLQNYFNFSLSLVTLHR